jgi:arsenate reductase
MCDVKSKLNVLFLCTGNSCRSQIAEGWARHLKGDVIEAFSAGISPARLNEKAVEVMAEAGVDISNQIAKHVGDLFGIDFDYVITLCDHANEYCPAFPGRTKHIHRSFLDPSFLRGTRDEVMAAFRKTRDDIKAFVETLPESLEEATA